MKVLTFSRNYPAYHQKKGQETYFIEKVLKSLDYGRDNTYYMCRCEKCGWQGTSNMAAGGNAIADTGDYDDVICPKCYSNDLDEPFDMGYYLNQPHIKAKGHTIRAGKRWEPGDMFSARAWSGKPYNSKQIVFAEIKILKTWDFDIARGYMFINRKCFGNFHPFNLVLQDISKNDGLDPLDFYKWFAGHPKAKKLRFSGQIICWNENINY